MSAVLRKLKAQFDSEDAVTCYFRVPDLMFTFKCLLMLRFIFRMLLFMLDSDVVLATIKNTQHRKSPIDTYSLNCILTVPLNSIHPLRCCILFMLLQVNLAFSTKKKVYIYI